MVPITPSITVSGMATLKLVMAILGSPDLTHLPNSV